MRSLIEAGIERAEEELVRKNVTLLFSGQGTQEVGMGRDLYKGSPAARNAFEQTDELAGFPLSSLCFEGPKDKLDQLDNSQLAIFTVAYAHFQALIERFPDFLEKRIGSVGGHSFGQFMASVVSGALEFPDAFKLVNARATATQRIAQENPGEMRIARVGLDQLKKLEQLGQSVQGFLEGLKIHIAAFNSPEDYTITARKEDMEEATPVLDRNGIPTRRLHIGGSFHHPLFESVIEILQGTFEKISVGDPKIPILSNTSGSFINSARELVTDLLRGHVNPVQFIKMLNTASRHGAQIIVSIEPSSRPVLAGLVAKNNPLLKIHRISGLPSIQNFNLAGV